MRGLSRSPAVSPGAGMVAVGVGLILGATYLPAPINLGQTTPPAPSTKAREVPVRQTLAICPGPEELGIEGLRDTREQSVSVMAVVAPAVSLPSELPVGQGGGSLTISGVPPGGKGAGSPVTVRGQVVTGQLSAARSALITGVGAMAPGTVATQWSWTTQGDRRRLAAAACAPAASSSWLIAGGGEPGRLEHLVLANPGPNPVTVDVRVLGVRGPVQSPNGHGLIVAGHTRMVILLDAIAGSEPSPVVHVTARDGRVAAFLSDSLLDGVVPRGGDYSSPAASPAREQVIAGVPIDGRALLRVAVPGERAALVQSRVLTPSGPRTLPTGRTTGVAGGTTADIDLGSLPRGAYAVQVRADVPLVAAATVDWRRAPSAPSDLAWSVSSSPIGTLAGMALPASQSRGLSQRLDLAATGVPASVRVATVGAGGRVSTRVIVIVKDSVSTLSLNGASSVWVTPLRGIVRAAVLTTAADVEGTLLSLTPLTDLPLTTTPVRLLELPDRAGSVRMHRP